MRICLRLDLKDRHEGPSHRLGFKVGDHNLILVIHPNKLLVYVYQKRHITADYSYNYHPGKNTVITGNKEFKKR